MSPPVRHPSPPLALVAGVHLALFVAALAVTAALAGGAVFPSPFDPPRALAYFQAHPAAVRVGSFFLCGAAIPLGVFAATVASRLTFLGVRVAGVSIGSLGGAGAAWLLLLSGLCMWALGQPGLGPDAVRVLHLLAFASGGPGFVMAFGIFVLGVSLAGGLTRENVADVGIPVSGVRSDSWRARKGLPRDFQALLRQGSQRCSRGPPHQLVKHLSQTARFMA